MNKTHFSLPMVVWCGIKSKKSFTFECPDFSFDMQRSQPGSRGEQLFQCIKNILGHTLFLYNIANR